MSAAVWVSLLTLVVSTAVALVIAALHRRQMRQIELHREDPSVPLVPPPSAFTKFLQQLSPYEFRCKYDLEPLFPGPLRSQNRPAYKNGRACHRGLHERLVLYDGVVHADLECPSYVQGDGRSR